MKSQKFQTELESYRLEVDYLKHLTTLSTASILVVLTMSEHFESMEESKHFLFCSLIGFLVTILCSVYLNFRLVWCINDHDIAKKPKGLLAALDFISFIGSLLAFLVSIALLVAFIYRNVGL